MQAYTTTMKTTIEGPYNSSMDSTTDSDIESDLSIHEGRPTQTRTRKRKEPIEKLTYENMSSQHRDKFRNLVVLAWIAYISTLSNMWDTTDQTAAVQKIMNIIFPAEGCKIRDTRDMIYRFVGVFPCARP
jgi:hypothetical protein